MSNLQYKVDFVALASVEGANPNSGMDNRPRTDYEGIGEISDVCIKRKVRNRLQDFGENIFVQSDDRCDDGFACLKDRFNASELKDIKDKDEVAKKACEKWTDVRTFGQVFAFGNGKKGEGVSVGVRGPVSIHIARSVSEVEVESIQITKSTSGELGADGGKGSDTIGVKHFVRFGLYKIQGSINVQLAEKTGFTEEDADKLKEALKTLFINDASSARPDGSMEIEKLYWWKHNCRDGNYSAKKVHNLVNITQKDPEKMPSSVDDYEITVDQLPGLELEVVES